MIEKNSFQPTAISIEEKIFQSSAISSQLFRLELSAAFTKETPQVGRQQEMANIQIPGCRIVCDETSEDFRLTLCRTLCAGTCPNVQDSIRDNRCESVAVFPKAKS